MKIKLNHYQVKSYQRLIKDLKENNHFYAKLLAAVSKSARKMTKLTKEVLPKLPKNVENNQIEVDEETVKKCMEYITFNNEKIRSKLSLLAELNPEKAEEMEEEAGLTDLDTMYDLFDFSLSENQKKSGPERGGR